MSEVEELRAEVERLRADYEERRGMWWSAAIRAGLAADRADAAGAEVEELRAEVKQLRRQWHQEVDNFERETARAEAAEARLARVEALTKWAVPRGYASHEPTRSLSAVVPMIREDDLHAALAAEPAEACDTCDGMGRVEWEPGNQARGGRDDQPCPDCAEVTPPAEQRAKGGA